MAKTTAEKKTSWRPEKPGSLMTDAEVVETPVFNKLINDPVMHAISGDKKTEQKRLARTVIDNIYHKLMNKRIKPHALAFLEALKKEGINISEKGLKVFPDGTSRIIVGSKSKPKNKTQGRPGRPSSLRKVG